MRQRLLNSYEAVTYDSLRTACEPNGAQVFPKVRVADVLRLDGSGISKAHFGYGLRAHFDFVVVTADNWPMFSVEFDGPLHESDESQKSRDRLKNDLCEHFGYPLLRINAKYLTKEYRGLDLLTYFVEAWFLGEAFDDAQQKGLIPYDEPFDMTYVYSADARSGTQWPYWLSLDIQNTLQALHEAGSIGQTAPSHIVGVDADGSHRCLSWLVFDAKHVIEARTGMRAQRFPFVDECDLVSMLAMFDMLPKVKAALRGDRAQLLDRDEFFASRLPAFRECYEMRSALSIGPTI